MNVPKFKKGDVVVILESTFFDRSKLPYADMYIGKRAIVTVVKTRSGWHYAVEIDDPDKLGSLYVFEDQIVSFNSFNNFEKMPDNQRKNAIDIAKI